MATQGCEATSRPYLPKKDSKSLEGLYLLHQDANLLQVSLMAWLWSRSTDPGCDISADSASGGSGNSRNFDLSIVDCSLVVVCSCSSVKLKQARSTENLIHLCTFLKHGTACW